MVIYDAIQSSPVPVEVYCVGKAYSMGAVLLACGKKGKRYLLPHSRVMIHEPLIPYGVGGKTSSIQTISESLLKAKRSMEEILAKHTGKTADEIAEATKTDHYFSAEEAVEFGLADGIMGLDEMMKGCM
jgi:ATP-dependent Clp protease protease subunit